MIFHDSVYSYRPGLIVHKDKKDNKNMFTGTAQKSKFLLIISKKNIYKYPQMLNIQMDDKSWRNAVLYICQLDSACNEPQRCTGQRGVMENEKIFVNLLTH